MDEKGGEGLMQGVEILIGSLGFVCLVFGAFFAIRGFYKYKEWRAGEKDEFWTFLAMILACGGIVLSGLFIFIYIGGVSESLAEILTGILFIGILLGLGAIGLTTFYYFQKWQSAK
jgi:hypothetical protein